MHDVCLVAARADKGLSRGGIAQVAGDIGGTTGV